MYVFVYLYERSRRVKLLIPIMLNFTIRRVTRKKYASVEKTMDDFIISDKTGQINLNVPRDLLLHW